MGKTSEFFGFVRTYIRPVNPMKGLTQGVRPRPKAALIPLALVTTLALESQAFAINCAEVRQLTGHYLRMHYSQHTFDDDLSMRTLETFVRAWDPSKVYFLKADVDRFKARYGSKLDDMINSGNCKAIDNIVAVFSKRFAERHRYVSKAIQKEHNFDVDEHMMIDRKKLAWGKTTEELDERWRKRIKFQHLQFLGTLDDDGKIRKKLHKRYELAVKRQNEMDSDDVYALFLSAFSSSLDPHSDYMSPQQLEDFRISTSLSLDGIGAVLRSEDGFTTIQSLVPGGAASRTKRIEADDKIIAVGQGAEPPVDVIDMDLREVVAKIRGTRGTEVRLTLVRQTKSGSKRLVVPVIREKIQLEDREAKSFIFEVEASTGKKRSKPYKIGLIDLPSFYMDFEGRQARKPNFKRSSVDMARQLVDLKRQKVDAVIVDLRSNGGGSLEESIRVAGLFIKSGPVVQIKGVDKEPYVSEDDDEEILYRGPLIVMIDRQSASASEIFAGAIQDYGRGIIVGDSHTFGKGTVQNLNDLSTRLGAIKVTISKFYRPSGASTQVRGVASDIVLPSLLDQFEIGEKNHDYALPWDKIRAAKFKKVRRVSRHLSFLSKRSESRIGKDEDFKEVLKGIDEYKKNEAERSRVSLKKKSNEEKAKELAAKKKDDKSKSDDDDSDSPHKAVPSLEKDFYLREAVMIATDYARSLAGQKAAKLAVKHYKPLHHRSIAQTKVRKKSKGVASTKKGSGKNVVGKGRPFRGGKGDKGKESK